MNALIKNIRKDGKMSSETHVYDLYVDIDSKLKRLEREVETQKPVLRTVMGPIHPFDADHRSIGKEDFTKIGANLGVDRLEAKILLMYALCDPHEDEVINAAIKKLLVLIKMRLPEDNDLVQKGLKYVDQWEKDTAATKELNLQYTNEYNVALKKYEAYIVANRKEQADRLNAIVRKAFAAHQMDTKTVWDTLCIQHIKTLVGDDVARFVDEGFDKASINEIRTFSSMICARHKNWLHDQFENLVDKIHNLLWETVPCEVDADNFLQYFDELSDPNDDAMTLYEQAMSEWDDELRWRARDRAKRVIQQRIADKVDGYDGPTHGY